MKSPKTKKKKESNSLIQSKLNIFSQSELDPKSPIVWTIELIIKRMVDTMSVIFHLSLKNFFCEKIPYKRATNKKITEIENTEGKRNNPI